MFPRAGRRYWLPLLAVSLGCGGEGEVGSSSETGSNDEVGGDEASDVGEEPPGPDGPGCDVPWEAWWDEPQENAAGSRRMLDEAEARSQRGRWRVKARVDERPVPRKVQDLGDRFRSTLISESAVLSTGRNLGVSWCLGNIEPNPLGPMANVNEELDAKNLERYELFREELEASARTWERHRRMNFVHLASLDDRQKLGGGDCDTTLEHVWFRAQTRECNIELQGVTNAGGDNEFDPEAGSPENPEGYDRILCIAWNFLEAAKTRIPYYAGHESGHIVGLDHEHIRWDQGDDPDPSCTENSPFEPVPADRTLTPPDPASVMGYEECEGAGHSAGISPADRLGAYFVFNWPDRRVRDMAPATGGRSRRLWSGGDQPGVLWYLPFSDHLLEWRFGTQEPGPLDFDALEHCLDGTSPPCSLADERGHWHPVMGQFAGDSQALDVFMYGADDGVDLLLRNDGGGNFEALEAPAPSRAIPVVGNFGSGVRDQILWYQPGPAADQLWVFADDGSHELRAVDQDGWRIPIPGHFRSRTASADILWFDPRDATLDTWLFVQDFDVLTSGPANLEELGVSEGTEYLPIVGNFDGNNQTDLFWYAPGTASDWLWLSNSNVQTIIFNAYEFNVSGEYNPLVGDFDGDGDDDIFWYRTMVETAGGLSRIWYFDGAEIEARSVSIKGDYLPYVEDFDGDGCSDILWYDPVTPGDDSAIWRCLPESKTFSCDERLPVPKTAYPIGFATGGY